jgi:ornithine cyclodeaminase/alanine dehydrogenase-like protein (mu-crystallin family)
MRASTNLTEDDVRRRLDPAQTIAAIENAFRDRFPFFTFAPRMHLPVAGGVLLIMSCHDSSSGSLGMKLVKVRGDRSSASDNFSSTGGARVQATYLLLDPVTAAPRLTIAANYLTALRTAATSALATRYLAREDATTLGIFGTGYLARAHLRVLPLVRNFQRILVCGREVQRSADFAMEMSAELHRSLLAVDAHTLASKSDVICGCTTSSSPLFHGNDLRPGTHLNLAGAFQPHTREVDTFTMQHGRIVVDTFEGARSEAGDILIPMQQGAISAGDILSDLHELVSGKKQGRRGSEDITVFKSVGCALEDLVTAELLQVR